MGGGSGTASYLLCPFSPALRGGLSVVERGEVQRYDLCVLWWKNRAVGSDTVKMTGQSDVSDSHGTAGREEFAAREAVVGNC